MSDNIQKIKRILKPQVDWPESLKTVSEINLFEEVMETLKAADNKNENPSS